MYGHHSECAVENRNFAIIYLQVNNEKYDKENGVTNGVESDVNDD